MIPFPAGYVDFGPADGGVLVNDVLWVVAAAAGALVAATMWFVARPALQAASGVNASSAEFAAFGSLMYAVGGWCWAITEGDAQGHWEAVSGVSAVVAAVFTAVAVARLSQAGP